MKKYILICLSVFMLSSVMQAEERDFWDRAADWVDRQIENVSNWADRQIDHISEATDNALHGHGGNCVYEGKDFSPGAILNQNGQNMECQPNGSWQPK